jgi:2-dehydro-3-deoxygluconokinase
MKPEQLNENYIRQAQILHVTGITAALSHASRETLFATVQLARKHGVKVSFDPNLRLKLWSVEEARPVLLQPATLADDFLPGLDEFKLLYDTDDMPSIIEQLRKLNATCIVKGANESILWIQRDQIISIPFHPVKQVVDTVGAGDGFCAGFLSGILRGFSIVEAIRLGSVVGALVVQGAGDCESAPTWEMVEEELQLRESVER